MILGGCFNSEIVLHLGELKKICKIRLHVYTSLRAGVARSGQPSEMNITGTIDILGPRLPTHTWRGRHMYEESKMASSTGQKTRELYYEK